MKAANSQGRAVVVRRPARYRRTEYNRDEGRALRDRLIYEAMTKLGWHPDQVAGAMDLSRVHIYRLANAHLRFKKEMGDREFILRTTGAAG